MPAGGGVTRNAWSEHEARLNGARNSVKSMEWTYARAEKAYEDAKSRLLRAGSDLDLARFNLEMLENGGISEDE